jgi:tRNA threonylcarbamoyladenosine biosynthesis protein TsaE
VTLRLRTTSGAATQEVAAVVAEHVRPGDLLLLVGDLGAGKTTFAQGLARALGIDDVVTSPTFTLARTYPGRLPMHHVDVYRLDRMAEVDDLALGELIDSKGVTLVEWGDAIVSALPSSYLEVRLEFGADPDERTITVRAVGPVWQPRAGALGTNLGAWTAEPC